MKSEYTQDNAGNDFKVGYINRRIQIPARQNCSTGTSLNSDYCHISSRYGNQTSQVGSQNYRDFGKQQYGMDWKATIASSQKSYTGGSDNSYKTD